MGNEGSLPEDAAGPALDDAEELEYQAKAPPSATTPPGMAHLPNNNNLHPLQQHQQHSERSGRKLMGAVFTRRGNANNQNSTGIERAQPPLESALSLPPSEYGTNGGISLSGSHNPSIVPMPGEDLTYMNPAVHEAGGYNYSNGPYGTNQDADLYRQQHHHHPPSPHQPLYIQNQHAATTPKQHITPTQQYYDGQQQLIRPTMQQQQNQQQQYQQQQQQQDGDVVGVMYQRPQQGQSVPAGLGTATTISSTKKARPAQRAGAALINSMRNLSLGSAMQRATGMGSGNSNNSTSSSPTRPTGTAMSASGRQQVNDWETRWDEDEDEEEEELDEEDQKQPPIAFGGEKVKQSTHPQQQQQPLPTPVIHPQIRRDLDSGFAAATVAANSGPPQVGLVPQATSYSGQQPPLQQQQQPPSFASPTPPHLLPQQQQQKSHLVTAIPDTPGLPTGHREPAIVDDDGVEWDTGIVQAQQLGPDGQPISEKPNVQQFLPLLRVLGKGSFGKVVLVQKRVGRERGALFAMKILRKSHLVRRRQIERTRTERKVLSVVDHPFIMKLHYAFQTPDKLYLVLDYCPGGELFFHLSRFRRFPERVARFYAAELLLALGHLHKRGIIYRDLKPENVLLDADGHVKLGDFGLAKAGIRHAYEGATSMCGTPEYMAPEVLAQQGHGFCVDYWGLGMLTYEMMTGLPPWYTTDRAKLFRRLRSAPLDIPSYFSVASASFTSALLERNPRRRLGVTGIRAAMEHEFFKSISWRALYGRRVEAPIRPCEGWSPPDPTKDEPSQFQHSQQGPSSNPNGSLNGTDNNLNHNDLDAATANFDNQFTRMPVETDDHGEDVDEEDMEELHEDTFVGFTFDDADRDELETDQQQQQQQARQRTHHYGSDQGGNGNSIHGAAHHVD